jgi:VWFA-related protein
MRFRKFFPGALLVVAASACAQTAAPAPAETPVTTLNVTTRLVVVPVTIRDSKEHLIRDLKKEDFSLTVDGKPQAIRYFDQADDVPLTVGLLVDVSGSMRNNLDAERTASSAFLDGMLQPGRDAAFVVQFGHNADLLADVTGSIPKLQAGLQKIEADDSGGRPSFGGNNGGGNNGGNGNGGSNDPNDTSGNNNGGNGRRGRGGNNGGGGNAGGGTVLYDSVFLSSDEVLKKAPAAKVSATAVAGAPATAQARKAIVLLTDGDDRGSKENLTEAIEAAQRNDVTIYAIYYKGQEGGGNNNYNNGGGGGRRGGFGIPGMGGGRGGGFPGGGGGGYPGGGGGGGNNGGRSRVDGKKILERMADETGGRVFEVTKKETLPDIYKMIAEELRSQYRLGFTPVNNDEGYHKLVVVLPKQPKLILQNRDGYYTGGQK